LGRSRFLDQHPWTRIEDEEILRIECPDGGSGWVFGAGPGLADNASILACEFSIVRISDDLASVLWDYARRGGYVIAQWPVSESRAYVWEGPEARKVDREDYDAFVIRSVPVRTFSVSRVAASPADWPPPIFCESAARLASEISAVAAQLAP
jgi:hypothetical protein